MLVNSIYDKLSLTPLNSKGYEVSTTSALTDHSPDCPTKFTNSQSSRNNWSSPDNLTIPPFFVISSLGLIYPIITLHRCNPNDLIIIFFSVMILHSALSSC